MQNTQLIKLLAILSPKELVQFNAYLNKVERPSNKQVVKLFLRLKKYAPNYDSPKLDRHKVAQYLFKSIDTQALNKTAFTLKSILQEFLVFLEIENNAILKEQLLVKALKDRNHPAYAKRSKLLIDTIEKNTDLEVDSLALFQLNYALSSDANTAKIGKDLQELNAANQHLDQFYFYHKLKIILEHRIAKKINNSSWSIDQELAILDIMEKHPSLKDDSATKLFLLAIDLISSPKKESYLHLKASLFQEAYRLSKKDIQDVCITLTFHNNQHLNTDVSFYTQEVFELFKFADQQDLLVVNGRIRNVEYTNAASVGFHTKNEEWTHEFINRNKKFLAPDIRLALYAYVRSIYHFKKRTFEEVIELLHPFDNDPNLALNTNILIRSLLLRANFGLYTQKKPSATEEQFLLSYSSSFKRFLNSNKQLSPQKIEPYLQFLHFFDQLTKLQRSPDLEKIKNIKIEIDKHTTLALKGWLQSNLSTTKR